jgi:hypothetical protein
MYVVELDRPWLDTPLEFQGFPLISPEQIDEIRRYCRIVFIDPEREYWTPEPRKAASPIWGPADHVDHHQRDSALCRISADRSRFPHQH